MENEIELLNQTEEALLRLMKQYQSGQYATLATCIENIREIRKALMPQPAGPVCVKCGCGPSNHPDAWCNANFQEPVIHP